MPSRSAAHSEKMTSSDLVVVFSSTRADFAGLGPVIRALTHDGQRVQLLVGGTHLSGRHGSTERALDVPAGVVTERVGSGATSGTAEEIVDAEAQLLTDVGAALRDGPPKCVIVLGDRWELLAVCAAALIERVPIVHIHGGEVTEGAIDERIRHAVTKLADIHFCSTEEAARRLAQLGEEPWRIHQVGAPSLDRLRPTDGRRSAEVTAAIGRPLDHPSAIVTVHPPTAGSEDVASVARAVFDAVAERTATAIITAPGDDVGADQIWDEIDRAVDHHDHLVMIPSLGELYSATMANVDLMVGNSSSGIIEAASFRLPVVDVGDRQRGRLAPANVLHCGTSRQEILTTINTALGEGFRRSLLHLENPYGDGRAAERISRIVGDLRSNDIAAKRFIDR